MNTRNLTTLFSWLFCWLLNNLQLCSCSTEPETHDTTRINFGSCVWPDGPQDIWKSVVARNPDLWIWTGDITYLDSNNWDMFSDKSIWEQLLWYHFPPGDPNDYKDIWDKTKNVLQNSAYKQLESMCPIIGVWDDHDYGVNDGHHDNPNKKLTQKLFQDFLKLDPNDPRRFNDGVNDFYQFNITFPADPSQNQLETITKTVDIILLDIRTHWGEDPLNPHDMLGIKQWKWFEDIINNKLSGELTLIVSGIQILNKERGYCEQWGQNHYSQERLLTYLLSQHKGNKLFYDNTILISGDQHWGEIMHVTCISQDSDIIENDNNNKHDPKHHNKYRPTRDLYEITSSGLTHSGAGDDAQFIIKTFVKYSQFLDPDRISECLYNGKNFGELEISWDKIYNKGKDGKKYIVDYKINELYMNVFDEFGNLKCKKKYPLEDHSLIEYKEEELIDWRDKNRLLYEIDTSKFDGIYAKYHCYSHDPISDLEYLALTYLEILSLIMIAVTIFGTIAMVVVGLLRMCCKNKKEKQS